MLVNKDEFSIICKQETSPESKMGMKEISIWAAISATHFSKLTQPIHKL